MKLIISAVLIWLSGLTQVFASNCQDQSYRDFDFWLGNWQVSNTSNDNISMNHIQSINDGCGILEEYTTATGFKGKSLNIYNKQDKLWHQTWIDNSGLLLQLKGKLDNKSMVMEGTTLDQHQQPLLNRISWTPLANGDVRQHWQISNNHGRSWQTVFDGLYQKSQH